MGFRSIAILVLAMAMGSAAQAERYLVKFKSPETLKAMSQKLTAAKVLANKSRGEVAGMKLLGTSATAAQALNNVDLLVIEASDAKAIEALRANPSVAFVEAEFFHPAPKPVATRGVSTLAVPLKRGPIEMPWGIAAVKAPEAWAITRGENARVAILDTGVDVTHPALASRIEKTQNFNPGESSTDMADTVGHGTHVAGTVLADGQPDGLVGVAPAAKLLMGKVCGALGCSSVAIAEGINWGVAEKVSVISMSLGGLFISAGEIAALDAAEANGVVVVAASGNDGKPRVSNPAAYKTCVAVGAVDSTLAKADFSQWGPELDVVAPGVEVFSSVPMGTGRDSATTLDLGDGKGLNDVATSGMQGAPLSMVNDIELAFAGLGKPEDFATADVNGKIALISRGEITFKEKVESAIAAGAVGVLIYNNAPGLLNGAVTQDGTEVSVPVAMIEQTMGEAARDAIAAGQTVKGGISISASDYASLQGTSMATPHVAGVVALIRSANPNLTPVEVRALLASTATPLNPNDQNQFGAGLVNASAAVTQAASHVPAFLSRAN